MKLGVAAFKTRLAALEALLKHFSREGKDVSITAANLWIKSGRGMTDGPVNGLGNLIVGYNAPRPVGKVRTGFHNLVIGDGRNYSSYGGMVVGNRNAISNAYASESRGSDNVASGGWSSVSGGIGHTVAGEFDWQAGTLFEHQ